MLSCLKGNLQELAVVSISKNGPFSAILKQGSKQTDPNVNIIGVDENYLAVSDFNLEYGRNFTFNEVKNGATVIILTQAIVKSLFNNNGNSALNKTVSLNGAKYLVIGVLKEKASSFGFNNNRQGLIPVNTLIQRLQHYTTAITIKVADIAQLITLKVFQKAYFGK